MLSSHAEYSRNYTVYNSRNTHQRWFGVFSYTLGFQFSSSHPGIFKKASLKLNLKRKHTCNNNNIINFNILRGESWLMNWSKPSNNYSALLQEYNLWTVNVVLWRAMEVNTVYHIGLVVSAASNNCLPYIIQAWTDLFYKVMQPWELGQANTTELNWTKKLKLKWSTCQW